MLQCRQFRSESPKDKEASLATLIGIATHKVSKGLMETRQSAIVGESGIVGDKPRSSRKRKITVLSLESWNDARYAVGSQPRWTVRRANLLVAGIRFGPEHVGKLLKIGDVVLRIELECEPCSRMDDQVPGLTAALTPEWRGGVTCSVVCGGEIHVLDEVVLLDP